LDLTTIKEVSFLNEAIRGYIIVVAGEIAQFLTSTRGINLKKRREDMKNDFRTLKGNKIKKALNSTEWGRVSNSLGKTSILSMLYRKRIKSNYHDIDSYLAIGLDAREIFHSLIKIVETLNLIHEACILKLIGETRIRNITDSASTNIEFASDRIDHLTSTIFSQ
jgi:hypothetical protein